jgi:hypothetical protein
MSIFDDLNLLETSTWNAYCDLSREAWGLYCGMEELDYLDPTLPTPSAHLNEFAIPQYVKVTQQYLSGSSMV